MANFSDALRGAADGLAGELDKARAAVDQTATEAQLVQALADTRWARGAAARRAGGVSRLGSAAGRPQTQPPPHPAPHLHRCRPPGRNATRQIMAAARGRVESLAPLAPAGAAVSSLAAAVDAAVGAAGDAAQRAAQGGALDAVAARISDLAGWVGDLDKEISNFSNATEARFPGPLVNATLEMARAGVRARGACARHAWCLVCALGRRPGAALPGGTGPTLPRTRARRPPQVAFVRRPIVLHNPSQASRAAERISNATGALFAAAPGGSPAGAVAEIEAAIDQLISDLDASAAPAAAAAPSAGAAAAARALPDAVSEAAAALDAAASAAEGATAKGNGAGGGAGGGGGAAAVLRSLRDRLGAGVARAQASLTARPLSRVAAALGGAAADLEVRGRPAWERAARTRGRGRAMARFVKGGPNNGSARVLRPALIAPTHDCTITCTAPPLRQQLRPPVAAARPLPTPAHSRRSVLPRRRRAPRRAARSRRHGAGCAARGGGRPPRCARRSDRWTDSWARCRRDLGRISDRQTRLQVWVQAAGHRGPASARRRPRSRPRRCGRASGCLLRRPTCLQSSCDPAAGSV